MSLHDDTLDYFLDRRPPMSDGKSNEQLRRENEQLRKRLATMHQRWDAARDEINRILDRKLSEREEK